MSESVNNGGIGWKQFPIILADLKDRGVEVSDPKVVFELREGVLIRIGEELIYINEARESYVDVLEDRARFVSEHIEYVISNWGFDFVFCINPNHPLDVSEYDEHVIYGSGKVASVHSKDGFLFLKFKSPKDQSDLSGDLYEARDLYYRVTKAITNRLISR